jgi:predicted 3-demethylubiquinone-9 3-methyltransferase (glyoxalase superfamily)
MEKVTPFLMFQDGTAEEAMNYYTSLIEDSEITSIVRYGANEGGEEGTVMQAIFSLKGQEFICIDSNVNISFPLLLLSQSMLLVILKKNLTIFIKN